MKMRISILLAVSAAAVVFALSSSAWRSAAELQTELDKSNARSARAAAALRQAVQCVASTRAEIDKLEAERRIAAAAAAKPEVGRRIDWAQWLKEYQARQRDPDLQLRELAAQRTKLRAKFAPLYRTSAWSQDIIAAFEDAEMHRLEQQLDLFAAISSQGISHAEALRDPELAAMYTRIQKEADMQERAALGNAAFAQLRDYRRTLTPREMVRGYAASAVMAGEPLTAVQAEQLVKVLASASAAYVKGGEANLLDIDWSRLDQAASPLLSPKQFELLQTMDLPPTGGRFWSALTREYSAAVAAEARASSAGGGG